MKFHNAQCILCHENIFDIKYGIFFKIRMVVRLKVLELIDLEGQAPWAGVISVCARCIDTIKNVEI